MTDQPEDDKLVEVWRAWGAAEVDIVRGLLESNDIPSAIRGESTRITHGFTLDGLSEVRILVRQEDAAEATRLLAETDSMTLCPGCQKPAPADEATCRFCGERIADPS